MTEQMTRPAGDQPTELQPLAYSIRQVSRLTSLGRSTIYRHISTGKLKTRKLGGRVVVTAEALSDFMGEG